MMQGRLGRIEYENRSAEELKELGFRRIEGICIGIYELYGNEGKRKLHNPATNQTLEYQTETLKT